MSVPISSFLEINGKPVSSFGDYVVQFDSLADKNSGHTLDGVMHIGWIWRIIRKVVVKMPPLTQAEISQIFSLVQGQEYYLTYKDPIKGRHTIHCYTSASNTNCKNGILYDGLWISSSFNAIEMEGEN